MKTLVKNKLKNLGIKDSGNPRNHKREQVFTKKR